MSNIVVDRMPSAVAGASESLEQAFVRMMSLHGKALGGNLIVVAIALCPTRHHFIN